MQFIPFLIVHWALVAEAAGLFSPLPKAPQIPKANPQTPAKIELGKTLYFDPRLSLDGTVSCNSCHQVPGGGTDYRPVSAGVRGQLGGRNSPTVWNAAFLSTQFWDGRAKTLEEQAKGPLINPIEMGMPDHGAVVARIKQIPGYVTQFEAAFGGKDAVNIDNVAKAIAAYERTLVTVDSPFDQFLRGKKNAISDKAKRGSEKVVQLGCVSCHNGPAFAGPPLPEGTGFFQKFPMFPDNPYVEKYHLMKDPGRFEATKQDADRHFWRVPGWRNVAETAPYFHNGSVATLDEAVRVMGKTQLNRDLSDEDVQEIVAFLESLTGQYPKQTLPRLPGISGGTAVPN